MKFNVDQELCIGCGVCESICSEVFAIANDKAQAILDPVPEALNEAIEKQQEHVAIDWSATTLSDLVDHIVDTHHAFRKEQLPRLEGLLVKVQKEKMYDH